MKEDVKAALALVAVWLVILFAAAVLLVVAGDPL